MGVVVLVGSPPGDSAVKVEGLDIVSPGGRHKAGRNRTHTGGASGCARLDTVGNRRSIAEQGGVVDPADRGGVRRHHKQQGCTKRAR